SGQCTAARDRVPQHAYKFVSRLQSASQKFCACFLGPARENMSPVAASHFSVRWRKPGSVGAIVARERILVVDDDRATADTLALLIETLGCEAKAVYNGRDAVQQIIELEPDMALVDICMPDRDGYDTVAGIRQQPGGTHVI